MSLLQKPKTRSVGSAWERLWSAFVPSTRRARSEHKPRRLMIDALEERALLSVSPAGIASKLLTTPGATITSMHMAEDAQGDFVVVWAQNDTATNPDGSTATFSQVYAEYLTNEVQKIALPADVLLNTDGKSNTYATVSITFGGDSVQTLSISPTTSANFDPLTGISANAANSISGTFKLVFTSAAGTTYTTTPIQFNEGSYTNRAWTSTLTADVTAATTSLAIADTNLIIPGSYVIQVGAERMLATRNPANGTLTVTRGYDNTTATAHSAGDAVTIVSNDTLIQEALRALGNSTPTIPADQADLNNLKTVTVTATDSQHYTMDFNDNNPATNLFVKQLSVTGATWGTGFLPAAEVTVTSQPFTVPGIKVSPTNPALTALSIQDAFNQFSKTYFTATNNGIGSATLTIPTVSVTSVPTAADPSGLRTFDIEFIGDAADTIVPIINVSTWNDSGVAVATPTTVTLVKQNTGIFRVNPTELDNPFTQKRDLYNDTAPAVAMDAGGDFVITWQGQVPDYENPGSVTDIFARLYRTGGSMQWDPNNDGVYDATISGVHLVQVSAPYSATLGDDDPLKVASDLYTFRVNVYTANAQSNPSVGMDAIGDFTIAWSNTGQPVSYFNGIYMRQFGPDGTPNTATDVMVSDEDTTVRDNPYVVTSADGHTFVMWDAGGVNLYAKLYDAIGNAMSNQTLINDPAIFGVAFAAVSPSACFDGKDNIAITFTATLDVDYTTAATGLLSNGVYLMECSLAGFPDYSLTGPDVRPLSQVNGALTNPAFPANDQVNGQVAMDTDGDLTVAYSGFGPDTNGNLRLTAAQNTYLQSLLTAYAAESNTGLTAAQKTWLTSGGVTLPFNGAATSHSGDIDSEINEILITAQSKATGGLSFTTVQAGRLRAILEDIADLARGDASAVMYMQSDADPTLQSGVLNSDQIVNSQRDGNNATFLVVLNQGPASGATATVSVSIQDLLPVGTPPQQQPALTATAQFATTPVYAADGTTIIGYKIDDAAAQAALGAIQAALAANPYCQGMLGPDFTVRKLSPAEIAFRTGTAWDVTKTQQPYVYEITFEGDLHDTPLKVQVSADVAPMKAIAYAQSSSPVPQSSGSVGTPHYDAQIGITADGSFTITYLQDNLDGAGNVTSTSIYFRNYTESTDTAGPTVTDTTLVSTSGETADLNLSNTATVQHSISYAVVDVSEALYNNLAKSGNAASNPANYVLYDSTGTAISGAISSVYFGLNEVSNLAQMAVDNPTLYGPGAKYDFSALSLTPSNRYEIVIAFGASGSTGSVPLTTGTYTLKVLTPATSKSGAGASGITDVAGNGLGYSGYFTNGVSYSVKFSISVTSDTNTSKVGTEVLVNQTINGVQTTSSTGLNVYGDPAHTNSIACDANGDFAVVWLQYAADGTTNVYMRLYNNVGNPLTNEKLVNTYTTGNQTEASVAMDADGDFVVVWASQGQDPDGSWGIYGQRFNAVGTAVGGEFRVNTKTANDQLSPAVTMDSKGDFIVVWATQGQSYSYFNGIEGQIYNCAGTAIGSEFAVNSQNIPGTGLTASNNQLHPAIAMSDIGTFVVTWTDVLTQTNNVASNSIVVGRTFTWTTGSGAAAANPEFQISVGSTGFISDAQHIFTDHLAAGTFMASNATVAMNSAGQFVVVWEAFQDNDQIDAPIDFVNSYGIYYRQFSADGTPTTAVDEQANQVVTALDPAQFYSLAQSALYNGNQLNPSVSLDTDGDFTITWDGNGSSTTNPADPSVLAAAYDQDTNGVWTRSFHATLPGDTTNPAISPESRVNSTGRGIQESSSVAMTANGSYIVAWSGNGTGDNQGVFFKIYQSKVDVDGPFVTDATLVTKQSEKVDLNVSTTATTQAGISYIVVDVSEALYDNLAQSGDAASNPANYVLTDSTGKTITGAFSAVYFGFDEASSLASTLQGLDPAPSGKFEIVLVLDGNGSATGVTPLPNGTYTLKILAPTAGTLNNPAGTPGITDTAGNNLNSNAATPLGSNYTIKFSTTASNNVTDNTGTETLVNQTIPGVQTTTSTGVNVVGDPASTRDVACDNAGEFAVVWLQYAADGTTDVYMRLYDNTGKALTNQTLVNTFTVGNQTECSVAMDADGDFVVVWASQGQDPDGSWGIYGQRFNAVGKQVGTEFRVNTNTANDQVSPAVAMDSKGDFVVVWAAQGQSYSYFNGVEGQVFDSAGNPLGSEFAVNSQNVPGTGLTASNNELHPAIAMGDIGTFVVVWTAVTSQANGVATNSIVVGREFTWDSTGATPMLITSNVNGQLTQSNTEFQISVGTAGFISDAAALAKDHLAAGAFMASNAEVAMNSSGAFVVTWEAFQDNDVVTQQDVVDSYGIYYRQYSPDGTAKTQVDEQANQVVTAMDTQTFYSLAQSALYNGDQLSPSVSMDTDGDFTITWSGNGSSTSNPSNPADLTAAYDQDTSGVWVRSFHSTAAGDTNNPATSTESRVNDTTLGVQQSASVAMNVNGGYVVVWSGNGSGDNQGVFFKIYKSKVDVDGPIVTGATLVTTTGDTVDLSVNTANKTNTGVKYIVLDVSEALYDNILKNGNAASNPANYILYDSTGKVIPGAISAVQFGFNEVATLAAANPALNPTPSGKYEVVITLNASGIASGLTALPTGTYTLKMLAPVNGTLNNPAGSTGITDLVGNKLNATATNVAGANYSITFSISVNSDLITTKYGTEILVNQTINGVQTTSSTGLNVYGDPANNRCVATDDKGDFVAVWLQYESDGTTDVYMRLYDSTGNPLTDERLVNTYTTGNQTEPAVAMDADGEYVIVWASQGQDPDGSWGIYGQRYNSVGGKVGGEFRVNTNTANDQVSPAVAMDTYGDFIVVWAGQGQSYSYFNTVRGQVYNNDGNNDGGEFSVNSVNIPGTGLTASNNELHPSISMSDVGTFMVAWTDVVSQTNGVATNSIIAGRMFTWNSYGATPMTIAATGSNTEFQVSVGSPNFISDPEHLAHLPAVPFMASNAQVTMNSSGQFIVVWEANQDNDIVTSPDFVDSYGIYFREFNADGSAKTPVDVQANQVVTANSPPPPNQLYTVAQSALYNGDQLHPSASMDADGDFVITWDGNGSSTTDQANPADLAAAFNQDVSGVWTRTFHATLTGYTTEPAVLAESRVNDTALGVQESPSVAMTPSGTYVVLWSGKGVGDNQGVFFKIYKEKTDTAGPKVTDFVLPGGASVATTTQVTTAVQAVVITFDKAMLDNAAHSGHAVTNPANYQLLLNGVAIPGGISQVYYGLDIANQMGSQYGLNIPVMNKYEAVLVVDANGVGTGVPPLTAGQYQIVALNSLEDAVGNPLSGTGMLENGSPVSGIIDVTLPTGQETKVNSNTTPAGATYGKSTTAHSVASAADGDYVVVWTDTTPGHQGVWATMYQQTSTINMDGTRSTSVTAGNEMLLSADPSATGAVVACDPIGDFVVTWSAYNVTTSWDVYAAMFDSTGKLIRSPFEVNTYTANVQDDPAVAMDSSGDSIITWQSFGQDGSGYGIYARRFDITGADIGGTNAVQVMTFDSAFTGTFKISWDADNNPATPDLVTTAITYSGNANAVVATVQAALTAIGADCTVTAIGVGALEITFTGNDAATDVPLVWVDPSNVTVKTGAAIGAIATATETQGASGEFIVNDTTIGNQMYPAVAMSNNGDAVVTWTSYGQPRPSTDPSDIFNGFGTYIAPQDSATQGNIYAKTLSLPVATSAFHITLVNLSGMTAEEIALAYEAAHRWEAVIVGTLSAQTLPDGTVTTGIQIDFSGVAIDGPGNILGQGGPDMFRPAPSFIPYHAKVSLDIADMESELADGSLLDVMTHEMAHCLGYGTIWQQLNLVTGLGTADPEFIGKNAVAAYNQTQILGMKALVTSGLFMDPATASGVPLENTGGQGTAGAHWRETVFTTELMTGYSNPGVPDPMSTVTVASMADLGYTVSYDHIQNNSYEYLVNVDDVFTVDPNSGLPIGKDNETGDQNHSSVAMDANGDFVIAWNSYGHDGGSGKFGASYGGENGVFARRYTKGGVVSSNVFQVNQTTVGNQQNPSVAMQPDGDFVVTWESNQNGDYDVYARWYARTSAVDYASYDITTFDPRSGLPFPTFPAPVNGVGTNWIQGTNPNLGPDGEMGGEILVNSTTAGDQRSPSVSLDDTGDAVLVWSGNGTGDSQGVFYQRFAQAVDDAPPTVVRVQSVAPSGAVATVVDSGVIGAKASYFIVTFSEAVSQGLVQNARNWSLTSDGTTLAGGIASVQYGLNEAYILGRTSTASGHYEAVVTFDGDSTTAGNQALGVGNYVLTLSDAVTDLSGNKLDGAHTGVAGSNFVLSFTVGGAAGSNNGGNVTPPGTPTTTTGDIPVNTLRTVLPATIPDVAADAVGNYVVVWDTNTYGDGGDIAVRRFDRYGNPLGLEFTVNPHTTTTDAQGKTTYVSNGVQTAAAVAMDAFGDFVVVWSGDGTNYVRSDGSIANLGDDSGIFAQVFDSTGKAVGDAFLVNQTVVGVQNAPAVAMDSNGDFVVTWTSANQAADMDGGVYARRFSVRGAPVTNEMLVNTTTAGRQDNSAVAMDGNGDFTVVWQSDQQDGSSWGIFGQQFTAAGARSGSEFGINTYTMDKQNDPAIAMDPAGDFVVAWQSFGQDGSGYGVYARRYTPAGVAKDAQEFRVNTTTLNWQITPDVGMDSNGNFVVTWASLGQDNVNVSQPTQDYGIYAHMYNANGTDYRNAATGAAMTEFRINATTKGDQLSPAIAVSGNDRIAVVWTGPETYVDSNTQTTKNDVQVLSRVIVPGSEAPPSDPAGPTISGVAVSQSSGKISWNAFDTSGVAGATLKIDGVIVSNIGGPYTAPSGVNYSALYGALQAGSHVYVITATDKAGNVSSTSGTFTLVNTGNAGPTISGVVVSQTNGKISWNAVSSAGVAGATLKIDGATVSGIGGPYAAASGVNYSASYGAALQAGSHSYTITATDKAGNVSSATGSFTLTTVTNPGPTISGVVVSQNTGKISWNAVSSAGVAGATLKIDGNVVSGIGGPYAAASGVNYSASYGALQAGSHSYTITATDKAGNVSSTTGSFTLTTITNPGPTVSGVVVVQKTGKISWNAVSSAGVASATLTIDGKAVSGVGGPYAAASGVNFSASYGALQAGSHSYTITATDKAGHVSTTPGTFTLTATANAGPTISGVVVALANAKMSWNVADSDGVASVGLTIDNASVSGVGGPYAAASGANYSWAFGTLGIGTHNYVIRAVDKLGNVSTLSGSFTTTSSGAAKNALFSGASMSALSNSAKTDWLYDFGGLLDEGPQLSSSQNKSASASATDAVLAGY